MQPLWESLVKWSYPVTSNAAPRCVPKRSESTDPSKHVYMDVHSSRIHRDKAANGPKACPLMLVETWSSHTVGCDLAIKTGRSPDPGYHVDGP